MLLVTMNKKVGEMECRTSICVEYSIDKMNNCVDLGYEDTGFLSSQRYYMCDEGKIPYNCIRRELVSNNNMSYKNNFEKLMRCD